MKVSDLIKQLADVSQDAEVCVPCMGCGGTMPAVVAVERDVYFSEDYKQAGIVLIACTSCVNR